LVVGAALRIGHYLARPSLSIDETMLALAVGPRSYHALWQPLDYAQTAPPQFLWCLRLAVGLGGVNEYALRVLPLVAGVILLPLLWRWGRRLLPPDCAIFTVALAALAPALVQFSVTAKPYITDATVSLAIVLVAFRVVDHPDEKR